MMGKRFKITTLFCLLLIPGLTQTGWAMGGSDNIPRMTKEELKPLVGNPDVLILDVRLPDEWKAAKDKIQGALREDPKQIQSWADQLPKDKTLVFYCS